MHALRHPIRFISIFALALSAVLLGNGGTAAAANPLLCFSGTTDTANGDTEPYVYGGFCTLNASGTVATLDTTVAGLDGSYAGVYYAVSSLSGMPLATVTASFDYAAAVGTTASGGSPRISIPIDDGNAATPLAYAFADTLGCNSGNANNGTLSLSDPICQISYGGDPATHPGYANWALFAAAHTTWRVSDDLPFVIVDQPGLWTVSNVQLGQGADADVATKKDECKKGGWANLTRADDSSFKNQGDCIQYVNTGK